MKAKSSRLALVLMSIVVGACVSVYAARLAFAYTDNTAPASAPAAGQGPLSVYPLALKANYQFFLSQPVLFPGYASASASISAQLIAVQDAWATIQYTAGPTKRVYTAAINIDHVFLLVRLE
jgi:hypothetical protein